MANGVLSTQLSSYLEYLPAIFRQDADEGEAPFVGRFLLAFEEILSGLGDPAQPGLEEVIDRIHTFFDPGPAELNQPPPAETERAPKDFLPWLAQWVALSLREDWEEEEKRRFINQMVSLYRQRGTMDGLKHALVQYTRDQEGNVRISEDPVYPYHFTVYVAVDEPEDAERIRRKRIAQAIIDQEKPAHTYYDFEFLRLGTIQVGVISQVGVDTQLGTARWESSE